MLEKQWGDEKVRERERLEKYKYLKKKLKTIIGKLKRKKIMTQTLMWLNQNVATINNTLQLLHIYKLVSVLALDYPGWRDSMIGWEKKNPKMLLAYRFDSKMTTFFCLQRGQKKVHNTPKSVV